MNEIDKKLFYIKEIKTKLLNLSKTELIQLNWYMNQLLITNNLKKNNLKNKNNYEIINNDNFIVKPSLYKE